MEKESDIARLQRKETARERKQKVLKTWEKLLTWGLYPIPNIFYLLSSIQTVEY